MKPGRKLRVIQMSQNTWLREITAAVSDGDVVIIDNLGEDIDATLEIWNFFSEINAPVINPADLTGDGLVNGSDLALVLAYWGSNDPDIDINDDEALRRVRAPGLQLRLADVHEATVQRPQGGALRALSRGAESAVAQHYSAGR